jgi:hypothetical protein
MLESSGSRRNWGYLSFLELKKVCILYCVVSTFLENLTGLHYEMSLFKLMIMPFCSLFEHTYGIKVIMLLQKCHAEIVLRVKISTVFSLIRVRKVLPLSLLLASYFYNTSYRYIKDRSFVFRSSKSVYHKIIPFLFQYKKQSKNKN